jgi:F0F1-type ATP synthase assembly protein I
MHDEANQDTQEDEAPIIVPSHSPLPPPPVVNYTRPSLGRRPSEEHNYSGSGRQSSDDSGGAGNHGAGLAAGSTFVVGIIAGAMAGNWIDQHYIHASMPWATLVMTLLGAAAGFSNMLRLLSRSDRNRKKK